MLNGVNFLTSHVDAESIYRAALLNRVSHDAVLHPDRKTADGASAADKYHRYVEYGAERDQEAFFVSFRVATKQGGT